MTRSRPDATPQRTSTRAARVRGADAAARLLRALLVQSLALLAVEEAHAQPAPPPAGPPRDAHPSPLSLSPPAPRPPTWDSAGPTVEQYGEIVIIEGSPDLLTDEGFGVGIHLEPPHQDPAQLTNAFYGAGYPDDFDEILVLTTFTDTGAPGALAYEFSVKEDVHGLGVRPGRKEIFDDTLGWGASKHRLQAFVNMKGISDYPKYDGLPIDDPRSLFYPVLGQEFAHRWLAFASYLDHDGKRSDRLLGRDRSHWSPTLQANGSVLDGNHWVQRADGSFDCVERQVRYSPLDLYLMGLLPAQQVPPMFVINNATTDGGHVIDPAPDWYYCEHVRGTREDIAISQIIDALGPRVPAFPDAPKHFRMAWVLVTRPGQHAGDVVRLAQQAERARRIWESKFADYSGRTGTMCTQVSVPCGAATAKVLGGSVVEAPASAGTNGNGVVEPGEPVDVSFQIENDGPVDAAPVTVRVESALADFGAPAATVDRVAAGTTAEVRFRGTFTRDAGACNGLLVVRADATAGDGRFKGFASVVAGAVETFREHFDAGAGRWGVNLDGSDDNDGNGWEWGVPLGYEKWGFFYQPTGGAEGTRGAWFTGTSRGNPWTGAWRGLTGRTTTLWSPLIDLSDLSGLSGASRPHVHYAAWFVELDTRADPPVIPGIASMRLEARSAGSGQWFQIDEVNGAEPRWRTRDLDLADPLVGQRGLDVSGPVQFRFTVTRMAGPDVVEAGIDEFAIVSDAPGCRPGGGDAGGDRPDGAVAGVPQPFAITGCATGGRVASSTTTGLLPALGLLALALRRLRRRRDRAVRRGIGAP